MLSLQYLHLTKYNLLVFDHVQAINKHMTYLYCHVGEMMMEPPTCQQWINRCREDKCCRKAYHDAHYYCKEIKEWKNSSLTAPPTCSDACRNAYRVLFNHPIGKNIKCCKCGTFSNVDEHNFSALKVLEYCKRTRRNMDNFCNVSQEHNCSRSRPTEEDRTEGNLTILY